EDDRFTSEAARQGFSHLQLIAPGDRIPVIRMRAHAAQIDAVGRIGGGQRHQSRHGVRHLKAPPAKNSRGDSLHGIGVSSTQTVPPNQRALNEVARTGSYVASKMSGLQGYNSPFTPRMIQSPGSAIIVPSGALIASSAYSRSLGCSAILPLVKASSSHSGSTSHLKSEPFEPFQVFPSQTAAATCTASMTTGFLRYLAMLTPSASRDGPYAPQRIRSASHPIMQQLTGYSGDHVRSVVANYEKTTSRAMLHSGDRQIAV